MSNLLRGMQRAFTFQGHSNGRTLPLDATSDAASGAVVKYEESLEKRPKYKTGDRGMKRLRDPSNAEVDIVFVHGLRGGRESTWTYHRTDNTTCLWPEKLLRLDIPKARILTWGYDADVISGGRVGSNDILGHADCLCTDLANERMNTPSSRPIIFVAHSLGGLVVKQALLHSLHSVTQDRAHLRPIVTATWGILFLGTPHQGSSQEQWASVILSFIGRFQSVNDKLVKSLESGNPDLRRLQDEFISLMRDRWERNRPLYVTCCNEERPTKILGMIVEPQSALISGYQSFSLPGDHRQIAKYGSLGDTGYIRISSEIQRWIKIWHESPKAARSDRNDRRPSEPHEDDRDGAESAHLQRDRIIKGEKPSFIYQPTIASGKHGVAAPVFGTGPGATIIMSGDNIKHKHSETHRSFQKHRDMGKGKRSGMEGDSNWSSEEYSEYSHSWSGSE
ncbi:hypothetical protein BU26DRAFT_602393 [Trematosphaeria pertusa]|uniref:DUF676 domain-containing protein n=1 Tax=Trematosphaeria pertusa TaxID=390896 RepID=A0A6A6IQV0_9PLEO|nr:uncharacterized protein BU26DRAFT_602393 [Trematosphaeria pertusa]KAF2251903.1 hypothetical protein BU26DRAFT_602393 [Trematosphaeria pertusa]